MTKFTKLNNEENMIEVIRQATNLDFKCNISGGWGYKKDDATIINSTNEYDIDGFELLLCTIRANIEMNITLDENSRYVSIAPTLLSQEIKTNGDDTYHCNNYTIEAVKELDFKRLSKEYKENYGKESFDMIKHFKQREECKISIKTIYWFKVAI